MRKSTKAKLARKLGYYPFLRLIAFNVWFRTVIILFLVIGLTLALCVPKIWTVSRSGFYPVIRVSLLDVLQAWSLRRTAEHAARAGQMEQALLTWGTAIAHNPAKSELTRGFLRTALQSKPTEKLVRDVGRQAAWLLRLSPTNQADVELAARAYDRCHLNTALTHLLGEHEKNLSADLQVLYLKALFDEGELGRFQQRWKTLEDHLPQSPGLDLYRAAYVAGWGPADKAAEAKQKLKAAGAGGAQREQANRILLQIARMQRDGATCLLALNRLADAGQDRLSDHTAFWWVLIEGGRKAEAAQLVQAYLKGPASVYETIELADVCMKLDREDLRKRALDLFDRSLETQGYSPIVCARYSMALRELKDWPGLRSLALRIRGHPGLPNGLIAYSYFMEGQADVAQGQRDIAEKSFRRLATFDYEIPELGLGLAHGLVDLGLLDQAMATLANLEEKLQYSRAFWQLYANAALKQTNMVSLLKATKKVYQLDPNDPSAARNYAAALLVERTDPPEALRITSSLMERPSFPVFLKVDYAAALLQNDRVQEAMVVLDKMLVTSEVADHAAALVQNDRVQEAKELLGEKLETSEVARLGPAEQSQYLLVRFEACLRLNLTEEALSCRDRIKREHLFPPQQRWLEENEKSLPPAMLAAPTG